jgi:uncharacterized protein
MLYLDTSILVSGLTDELGSPRIRAWVAEQEPGELHISDWVVTEFSSALSLKLRSGQIARETRDAALARFRADVVQSLRCLPVLTHHFERAAWLVDQDGAGLRAADALHLAVARDHGLMLCTLDKRLAGAAAQLGCSASLV